MEVNLKKTLEATLSGPGNTQYLKLSCDFTESPTYLSIRGGTGVAMRVDLRHWDDIVEFVRRVREEHS